ncbi:MAG: arylsulfatase A related enzyme, partial [halophilic archaeon J07HX5]
MNRPNVVLVVLDTARRDRVSAYGYDRETTPNFDQFATDATLYTDPVTQAPWSVPSHASLFTGAYPAEHGASTVRPVFGADAPLAERLRRGGYATAAVSANPYVRPANGFARGFEEFHGPSRPRGAAVPAPVVDKLSRITRPTVHKLTAARLRRPLERLFGLVKRRDAPTVGTNTDGPVADWLPAQVASVVARLSEPYFLFVNITTAHLPRSPAPAALERFVDPELRETPVVPNERTNALRDGLSERERQALTQLYDADLRTADTQLGEVLAIVDDAFVAVVSDHGEHLGEFGLVGHQYSVFEPA